MADFIDIETAQNLKKMSDSVGVGDAGGNCIAILVVVGEGSWGVVVGWGLGGTLGSCCTLTRWSLS